MAGDSGERRESSRPKGGGLGVSTTMGATWLDSSRVLGFLIPGPREVVIVLLVVLALYGRSGSKLLLSTRYGRMLSPWVRMAESAGPRAGSQPQRRAEAAPPAPKPRGRLYWALVLIAASAAAAWAATQAVVQSRGGLPTP